MKTILITGASDGIGKHIAIKLSDQTNKLILFGRNAKRLKEVKSQCEANGSLVEIYSFDLTNFDDLNKITQAILENNKIDILINNAGVWHKVGDLTSISEQKIAEVINLNLTSHILLTKLLLKQMRSRQDAAIINIISRSGIVAQAGQSVYTASKYGMKGFTDVLREDTKKN